MRHQFLKYQLVFLLMIFSLSACVQKTKKQEVTFYVNAKDVTEITSMNIRGQLPPLSWRKNYELIDTNKDSIYTAKIVFDVPYDFVEFKFVKNTNDYELKDQSNRRVYFDKSGKTEYKAIFNQVKE